MNPRAVPRGAGVRLGEGVNGAGQALAAMHEDAEMTLDAPLAQMRHAATLAVAAERFVVPSHRQQKFLRLLVTAAREAAPMGLSQLVRVAGVADRYDQYVRFITDHRYGRLSEFRSLWEERPAAA